MYDVMLTWTPTEFPGVTGYRVSWAVGDSVKTVDHSATDTQASFVEDTGKILNLGDIVTGIVDAFDRVGEWRIFGVRSDLVKFGDQ